jgi:hypothetical protein
VKNRIRALIIIASTTITASACGLPPTDLERIQNDAHVSAATAAAASDSYKQEGEYSCPLQANIQPDYDWELDGSGYYTACTHKSSSYSIKLHGKTSGAGTICVFPAQYIDDEHIVLKQDEIGAPMYRCMKTNTDGLIFTFDKTNFNALFIVEGQDLQQMRMCLVGGKYSQCPHYSYGIFR